jgi:hypothetical protein
MSKVRKAFALRIDPALYDALESWAQQEFRSVNGQIEYILREAVAKRTGRAIVPTAAETPTIDLDVVRENSPSAVAD